MTSRPLTGLRRGRIAVPVAETVVVHGASRALAAVEEEQVIHLPDEFGAWPAYGRGGGTWGGGTAARDGLQQPFLVGHPGEGRAFETARGQRLGLLAKETAAACCGAGASALAHRFCGQPVAPVAWCVGVVIYALGVDIGIHFGLDCQGQQQNKTRARGLAVLTPERLDGAEEERLRALAPDLIFSFYYRSLIPERILRLAPLGAFNMHGSLLPRYRGRACVNWAVLNGETETGVTLHHMTARADRGRIVDQASVPIGPDDTAHDVFLKLIPRTDHSPTDIALVGDPSGGVDSVEQSGGVQCGRVVHGPWIGIKDHRSSEERRVGKECRSRWSPYH